MARTSKSNMDKGRGESADRNLRALEAGSQGRSRANEALLNVQSRGLDRAEDSASRASGRAREHVESERRESLARDQMSQQDRQFTESQNLRAAERGLQPMSPGGGGQGGAGGEAAQQQSPREQALQAEMDRGAQETSALDPASAERLQAQRNKPLEMDSGGARTFTSTPEAREAQGVDLDLKRQQIANETLKAQAYSMQVATSFQRNMLAGDKEAAKKDREQLMEPIKSDVGRFDRFMNGEQKATDWQALQKLSEGHSDLEPSLTADLEAEQWTPRVQKFLGAKIAKDGLTFIAQTGELPDGDMVDLSSPMMQDFSRASAMVTGMMATQGMGTQQFLGITSMREKNAYINKLAAGMVLSGAQRRMARGPFGDMAPSAGQPQEEGAGPPAGPPPVDREEVGRGTDQPYATDEMTQKAIAAREAGRPGPPTDSPEFQEKFGEKVTGSGGWLMGRPNWRGRN